MKKLSSCVLVLSLCLSQCGSICSAVEVSKKQESIIGKKISLQGKNGNFARDWDKQSNKSKKGNKKHSKKTNINVDLTISSIVLGATVLGVCGIHEYAESKKPNIFEQFYSATGNVAKSMFSSSKKWIIENYTLAVAKSMFSSSKKWIIENYTLAKDWASEKCGSLKDWSAENYPVLKSWLNSTYYDTKDWFDQADTSEKVGAIAAVSSLSIVTLVGMFMCCCRGAKVPPSAPVAQGN